MKQSYPGGIKSPYDPRDYIYSPTARGVFDWRNGFDIEEKVGVMPTKDQKQSSSCGGQAWAYYGEVLEKLVTGDYEPRSAKWIYSQTFVQGGGSAGRNNCDVVIKKGWAREALVPSVPATEENLTTSVPVTKEIIEDTEITKALSYVRIPNLRSIDMVAQAIMENNGVILMIGGQNNGTWHGTHPEAPVDGYDWLHWVYAGKIKQDYSKKYIGIKNSWGDTVGENGWQWISEDYFNSGNVIEAWTLAWDYKPAKHKLMLIEMVKILTKIVELYKQLIQSK